MFGPPQKIWNAYGLRNRQMKNTRLQCNVLNQADWSSPEAKSSFRIITSHMTLPHSTRGNLYASKRCVLPAILSSYVSMSVVCHFSLPHGLAGPVWKLLRYIYWAVKIYRLRLNGKDFANIGIASHLSLNGDAEPSCSVWEFSFTACWEVCVLTCIVATFLPDSFVHHLTCL